MKEALIAKINPELDLVLVRETHVPVELVWKALTTPELIKQWFCPRPWKVSDCSIDLRPGGHFYTVMESPEGEKFPGESCIVDVIENRRLVWTSAMERGFRPSKGEEVGDESGTGMFNFTAVFAIEPHGTGTRYTAMAIHARPEERVRHSEMGFEGGWSAAFDQLVELMSGDSQ